MAHSEPIIAILGPTASGKSEVAQKVALKLKGEVVSADSMQIYKDMNIGTAKVLEDEMQGIKHYMLDIISPEERYSVSDFKKQAEECIEQILQKGKMPIICGALSNGASLMKS